MENICALMLEAAQTKSMAGASSLSHTNIPPSPIKHEIGPSVHHHKSIGFSVPQYLGTCLKETTSNSLYKILIFNDVSVVPRLLRSALSASTLSAKIDLCSTQRLVHSFIQ